MRDLWRSSILMLVVAVLFLAEFVGGQTVPANATHCAVCRIQLSGGVYREIDLLSKQEHWLCGNCVRNTDECFVCSRTLGAKGRHALPDGRLYCERDWNSLILDPHEAKRVFFEVERELTALLRHWGDMPKGSMTFTLVEGDEFIRQYRRSPTVHDPEKVRGLTRSRQLEEGKFEHDIFVLNGLRKEAFMAVCAHELTHAWLAERVKRQRALHDDTIEAFCELVAWQLMNQRNDSFEKERIESNDYTHGQFSVMRAAEDAHRFYRVVDWMLGGVDGWLEPDKLDRLHALRDDAKSHPPGAVIPKGTQSAPWATPTAAPTAAPDRLILRGLMGTKGGQTALINDAMLKVNESARIRLGTTNVLVRCVEIRPDAVLVEVEGAGRQTLVPGK